MITIEGEITESIHEDVVCPTCGFGPAYPASDAAGWTLKHPYRWVVCRAPEGWEPK